MACAGWCKSPATPPIPADLTAYGPLSDADGTLLRPALEG